MQTLLTTLLTFLLVISSQSHAFSYTMPIESERLDKSTAAQVKIGMSLYEIYSLIGQPNAKFGFIDDVMYTTLYRRSGASFRTPGKPGVYTFCDHSLTLEFNNNKLIKIKEAYRYECSEIDLAINF